MNTQQKLQARVDAMNYRKPTSRLKRSVTQVYRNVTNSIGYYLNAYQPSGKKMLKADFYANKATGLAPETQNSDINGVPTSTVASVIPTGFQLLLNHAERIYFSRYVWIRSYSIEAV